MASRFKVDGDLHGSTYHGISLHGLDMATLLYDFSQKKKPAQFGVTNHIGLVENRLDLGRSISVSVNDGKLRALTDIPQ